MKKVLIALASSFTNEVFQENFFEEGFEVATTNDGRKALEILKESPPDIVIADTNLPGMSAFDLLDEIKKDDATKRIPIIVYSRVGSDIQREKAMDHEAKDFVVGLSDSPKDIVYKTKTHLGEQKAYIFNLSSDEGSGVQIARDLGYGGGVKCPSCSAVLSLHLLRNLNIGKNTFKVSLICPKCSFRQGASTQ